MELKVIYEDDRVVAVDKPAGMPSIPGRGAIGEAAAQRVGRRVWVVHRLDRDASGLLLFAKDAETHRRLCGLFERRQTEKRYLAVVRGALEGEGRVEAPIREFGSGRSAVDARGKPSETLWRALRPVPGGTLVEARPVTGRRHQLRVHLYWLGHPIVGDRLYGKEPAQGRLMLHAWRLKAGDWDLLCPPPPGFPAPERA